MKQYVLSVQKNIRDLGGLKNKEGRSIKVGRLFRGGDLSRLNENDVKIVNSFHLTDIVDFRTSHGFMEHADYKFDNVNYHNIPLMPLKTKEELEKESSNPFWFMEEGLTGNEYIKIQYRDLINNPISQKGYREFFKLLVDHPGTYFFHCSQGKDRSGLAAAFLELALGMDMSVVKEDYLLSNTALKGGVDAIIASAESEPWFNDVYRQTLLDLLSAKEEYLDTAFEEINKHYQNIDNYLRNILEIDIEKLKELYLD